MLLAANAAPAVATVGLSSAGFDVIALTAANDWLAADADTGPDEFAMLRTLVNSCSRIDARCATASVEFCPCAAVFSICVIGPITWLAEFMSPASAAWARAFVATEAKAATAELELRSGLVMFTLSKYEV